MGQYFKAVNATKREFVDPWKIGTGAKLWEWCANRPAGIFPYLLRKSNGGGGGDLDSRTISLELQPGDDLAGILKAAVAREGAPLPDFWAYAGRWAGDAVYLIGDYDDGNLYQEATEHYRDISEALVEEYNRFIGMDELKIGEH